MKLILALAGMLIFTSPALASQSDLQALERGARSIGAQVRWNNYKTGKCVEDSMVGVYTLRTRTIHLCIANLREHGLPIKDTFQHELWHAVQHLCNNNRAILTDHKIRSLLTSNDKRALRKFYTARDHRLEAEARALERVPVTSFLRGVNHYCT